MPNVDSSDYTRRKKLAALHNANSAANPTKFRVLTRFDMYNPHKPGNAKSSADICTTCVPLADKSDIFAARAYAASRVPHFN